MTSRLAVLASRHPWRTVSAWAAALFLAVAAMAFAFGELAPEGRITSEPESVRALELKERYFGDRQGATEYAVLRSDTAVVTDPEFGRRVADFRRSLHATGTVEPPVDPLNAPGLVSEDAHAVMVPLTLTGRGEADVAPLVRAVEAHTGEGYEAGVTGGYTVGRDFDEIAGRDLKEGELQFGLPAALVVLALVFGALVATVLPLALAGFSIIVALGLTALLSQVFTLSTFILNMLVAMGLALGIDYALFIVSRFREERAQGRTKDDAIAVAGATASRAVLFSGSAFVLAMVGLLLVPDTVMRSLAAGAILVALVAVVAALTLLPALLALLGDRVDRLPVPYLGPRLAAHAGQEGRFWGRIVRGVLRRPGWSLAAAAGVLLVAAAPVLTMNLGQAGTETLPDELASKRGYLLVERSFPAGGADPAEVVVEGDVGSAAVRGALTRLSAAVGADPDFGEPAVRPDATGRAALVTVPLAGDSSSPAAMEAVERLRAEHITTAFAGVDARALVTGSTAFNVDYVAVMWSWLPLVIGLVLSMSFVLLTVAFRSVAIAATTILLNLLSVAAAYGLVVAVFQHGVGAGLLGFQQVDTVAPWLPLFMFAVLFGLSMDYQVFLLSRIRERYAETGETRTSVAYGIGSTARLITGAALIIVAVFAGFASGQLVMFQQMGFGIATALLIDATIIRSVLVPAAMGLLGERSWYLPRALQWLPHVELEGSGATGSPAPTASPLTDGDRPRSLREPSAVP